MRHCLLALQPQSQGESTDVRRTATPTLSAARTVLLALLSLTCVTGQTEPLGARAPAHDGEDKRAPLQSLREPDLLESEAQAAEWDSFTSKAEEDIRPMLERFPDQDAFNLEPPKSWKWWDDRESTRGKAIRGRLLRWLKANPLMEGASDTNLWFTMLFFEGSARMGGRIEELESQLPENAQFAGGFGHGSERERFHLWTGCKPLLPVILTEDDDAFLGSVRAAVESRLRGARLFRDEGDPMVLNVDIDLGSASTFRVVVGLRKTLFDPITRLRSTVYSDDTGGQRYGAYGVAPQGTVRNVLADLMDRFIADYLRVNAEACGVPSGGRRATTERRCREASRHHKTAVPPARKRRAAIGTGFGVLTHTRLASRPARLPSAEVGSAYVDPTMAQFARDPDPRRCVDAPLVTLQTVTGRAARRRRLPAPWPSTPSPRCGRPGPHAPART